VHKSYITWVRKFYYSILKNINILLCTELYSSPESLFLACSFPSFQVSGWSGLPQYSKMLNSVSKIVYLMKGKNSRNMNKTLYLLHITMKQTNLNKNYGTLTRAIVPF
jgi:hypothetical protein